jgi:hypothetical protein
MDITFLGFLTSSICSLSSESLDLSFLSELGNLKAFTLTLRIEFCPAVYLTIVSVALEEVDVVFSTNLDLFLLNFVVLLTLLDQAIKLGLTSMFLFKIELRLVGVGIIGVAM